MCQRAGEPAYLHNRKPVCGVLLCRSAVTGDPFFPSSGKWSRVSQPRCSCCDSVRERRVFFRRFTNRDSRSIMFHKFAPLMLACAGDDDQCGHNATVQELLERIGDREPQQALFVVIFGLCVGGG